MHAIGVRGPFPKPMCLFFVRRVTCHVRPDTMVVSFQQKQLFPGGDLFKAIEADMMMATILTHRIT